VLLPPGACSTCGSATAATRELRRGKERREMRRIYMEKKIKI
jgi:Fe-S cluster biogenesis protein NfuA